MHTQYFLNFEEALFTEPTPLVNDKNELIVFTGNSYLINANATPAQQDLAWDFIKYIMQPENNTEIVPLSHPTNRALLRHALEYGVQNDIRGFFPGRWNGTMDEAVEIVYAQMTAYGDMPMVNFMVHPNVIHDSIAEALRNFRDGLVSAEDTARIMQNQIELMMMEIGVRWAHS